MVSLVGGFVRHCAAGPAVEMTAALRLVWNGLFGRQPPRVGYQASEIVYD